MGPKTHFYLIIFLLVIWGCNPQESTVDIKTNGIFRPITFGLDGQDFSGTLIDKDEWVTSDGPMPMVVTVTNNSLFPYTDIDLTFSSVNNESTALRFKPLASGEDTFPGFGGTCTDILMAGTSCTIIIELNPPIDRLYIEQAQLSFKNYVDYEQHVGQVKVISGTPAELIIVDNPSRFRIGCDDDESIAEGGRCVRAEGLTERTLQKTYTQEVKIKNVGGLKARSIQISQSEKVENVDGQDECGDFCQAWTRENLDCVSGQSIKPQEECTFRFSFTPQNKSETIQRVYERIKYFHTTSIQYQKDPKRRLAALSINFETLSSKIEARLTSPETINLLGTVGTIQGNRSSKQIRLSNEGYNSARLKEIKIKYTSCGSTNNETTNKDLQSLVQYTEWAVCNREGTETNILTCRHPNPSIGSILGLSNLPFTIQDETNCLLKNKQFTPDCTENPINGTSDKFPLIPISCGCTFRVTFQPTMAVPFLGPASDCKTVSTAVFPDSSYDIEGKAVRIYPIYDSRWKNGEDHCLNTNDPNCQPLPITSYTKENFSFRTIVKRNSAARLTVESFKYDDQSRTPLTSTSNLFNNQSFYDLGRLSVLSALQKTRSSSFRKLEITVKNRGNAFALLDKITYQIAGNTYEIKTDSTLEPTLKDANNCTGNNCYYRNAKTINDCRTIPENGTCTLLIYMAPFKLSTDENELLAMFDSDSNGLITPKVKSFNFVYRNGYTYNDNEIPPATPKLEIPYATSVQFTAVLTKTAKLEELVDTDYGPNNTKNPGAIQGLTRGDDFTYNLYVSNIGSAKAGKINFTVQSGYNFATGTPSKENCLSQAVPKDCRCFNTTNPLIYQPNIYNESICSENASEFLGSDEVCKIPIRWNIAPSDYMPELADSLRLPSVKNKLLVDSALQTDELTQNDIRRFPYKIFPDSPNTYNLNTRLSYKDCYQLTITEFNSKFSPTNLPNANGYDTHFGYTSLISEYTNQLQSLTVPAQIVPTLPTQVNPKDFPWHTAFIYREAITSPTAFSNRIFFDTGSTKSINADVTFNRSITPKMPYFDSASEGNMLSSILYSYKYSPNLNLSVLGSDDVRYRIFMGYHHKFSLTSQTAFVFPFELSNNLSRSAKILSITDDGTNDITIYRMNGLNRAGQFNSSALPLTLTSTNLKLEAEINPIKIGTSLYKKEFEVTYETGKQTRNLDYGVTYSKCSNGLSTGFCEQKKVKFVIYGVIDATTNVPIDISTKSISVQPNASGAMDEYCANNTYTDYLEANGTWNQKSGGIAVSPAIQSISLTNIPQTVLSNSTQREKLAYTKRVIRLTNTQGPGTILRLRKIFLKSSQATEAQLTTSFVKVDKDFGIDEYIDDSRTNCDDFGIVSANKCKEGDELVNGQSCITVVRFRPTVSTNTTIYLSYLLTNVPNDSIPDDPHFIYNVPLSFQSIDPATISASGTGVSSKIPKHKASLFVDPPGVPNANGAVSDLTKNAWEVILNGTYGATPYVFSGTATPALEREITLSNAKTTPASFLMQYRIFKDNSLTSTRVPTESDFDTNGFTQIATNFYDYTTVFAKRGCFAGSEAISDMEFGGFTNTNTNCKLKIKIKLDHSNMLFTSDRTIDSRVNPYLVKLKFYSAFRAQVEDIYIYAWFRVRPKELNGTGLGWGTITSSFPTGTNLNPVKVLDDDQPNLGRVVGYRIYRTRPKSLSDDSEDNFPLITYNSTTTVGTITDTTNILKKDFYFDSADGTSDVDCDNNGCLFPGSTTNATIGQEKRFYYYRLALIRTHSSFTRGKELFAASKANQFITNISNIPQGKVLLPPTGYTYSHSNKLMILNTLSATKYSYNAASTLCTNSSLSIFDDTSSPSVVRQLLSETVFSLTGSSLTQPIWLGSPINYKFTDVGCIFATNAITEETKACVRYVPTATTGKKIINLPDYTNPAYAEPSNTALAFAMCFVDLKANMP